MSEIESLIFLLGTVAFLALLAQRLSVPYPIFRVFLLPLLNTAAFSSSPLELRAHLRPSCCSPSASSSSPWVRSRWSPIPGLVVACASHPPTPWRHKSYENC